MSPTNVLTGRTSLSDGERVTGDVPGTECKIMTDVTRPNDDTGSPYHHPDDPEGSDINKYIGALEQILTRKQQIYTHIM